MADVTVLGAGYVGLVTAACLAERHTVTVVDHSAERLATLLDGRIPFFEPGLAERVQQGLQSGRLAFAPAPPDAIGLLLVAVGTPSLPSGEVDLRDVEAALLACLPALTPDAVVVLKSTVPPGTTARLQALVPVPLVHNPEFLREGHAVADLLVPDRVVLGGPSAAVDRVRALYDGLITAPVLVTTATNAELIKHASNALLATRLAFVNELADLCERAGGEVNIVTRGMGLDHRIGPHYLQAGPGFGGSCLPKDTRGLLATAHDLGVELQVLDAAVRSNDRRLTGLADRVARHFGTLRGLHIAVLGLTFKAGTDDTRQAAAQTLVPGLRQSGAVVHTWDPLVGGTCRTLADALAASTHVVLLSDAPELLLPALYADHTVLDLRGRLPRPHSGAKTVAPARSSSIDSPPLNTSVITRES